MKLSHNPHGSWERPSAVVGPEYEAEVQKATKRAERDYRQAKERLAKAEARLTEARVRVATRINRKHVAELEALVALRRDELAEYERMMKAVAASAEHRGVKSFRPVPDRSQASDL